MKLPRVYAQLFESFGLVVEAVRQNRHIVATVRTPAGLRRAVTLPTSVSDQRSIHNLRRDLRRICNETAPEGNQPCNSR